MKYEELVQIFSAHEATLPQYHLDGHIIFSDFGSYEKPNYTMLDRTYIVSSNNKAYQPNRLGFSIFGSCLNGHDPCVRLENYMRNHLWTPGECCLLHYQLQSVNERELLEPQIYPTLRQAMEAMVYDLCKRGHLECEETLQSFDAHGDSLHEGWYSVERYSAWMNATPTGNWDWKIQPIRVFDLQNITTDASSTGKTERGDI